MIEISHKQARHLLRIELDHRLPHEQWNTLQAHLENCPDCRLYRDRLGTLERDLRRTLKSGWETVPGPHPNIPESVLGVSKQRLRSRQKLVSVGKVLAGILLVFFLGRAVITGDIQKLIPGTAGPAAATPDAASAVEQATAVAVTPIPTARAGDFPDVLLFEARLDGRADGKKQIYLLNPGSDPVDLFDGTANDSEPAWSPDGEWVAFLSDRSGKEEVFVLSMAGNKVVQLTNSPSVTWEGPLSWSADGQWIALSGVRNQEGDQHWVYLVGLDGSGAKAVSGSRGGSSPEFAPFGDRLAFTYSDGALSGVTIYHLETGEKVSTQWPENAATLAPAPGSSLDWSADGSGLVYIAGASAAAPAAGTTLVPGTSAVPKSGVVGSDTATAAAQAAITENAAAQASGKALPGNTSSVTNASPVTPVPINTPQWGGNPSGPDYGAGGSDAGDLQNGALADSQGSVQPGSQILVVRDLNASISLSFDFSRDLQITQSAWPGAYRGVNWTPGGTVLYLEDLGDARANDKPGTTTGGCLTIQARSLGIRNFDTYDNNNSRGSALNGSLWSVNGLCVEGGLDRESWTPDGRWLVVLGRLPSSQQRSLYAVRMPGRGFGFYNSLSGQNNNPSITPFQSRAPLATDQARGNTDGTTNTLPVGSTLRLVDTTWSGALPRIRPRLSPYSQPVNINPQPVVKTKPIPPPSDLSQRPDGPTGQIVYTVQNNTLTAVVKANPDGTGGQVLAMTPGTNRCPRFSQGGQSIALVGSSGIYAKGINPDLMLGSIGFVPRPGEEIYVMDAGGGSVHQVSSLISFPENGFPPGELRYTCPVWSPEGLTGGPFIAALASASQVWYLSVMPSSAPGQDNSAPLVRPIRLGTPLQGLGPFWSPDGHSLYLVQRPPGGGNPQLLKVLVPNNPLDPLSTSVVKVDEDWTQVMTMTIEPTGSGVIVLEKAGAQADGQVVFRRIGFSDAGGGNLTGFPLAFDEKAPQNKIRSAQMALLFGSRSSLGVMLTGSAAIGTQGDFVRYDLSYGLSKVLAQVEDSITDLAWSPDGRWVVYSSESGLWGLDMATALQGHASPVWLSPVPVQGLDWH